MRITAIVLAAGSGSRMGGNVRKQYLDLGGHPILWHSLRAFEESPADEIILVCPHTDIERLSQEYKAEFPKMTKVVEGGRERYHSVFEGLKAASDCDHVFIHDGARPFVDKTIIERCADTLKEEDACVAAVPSKDTVKLSDAYGYAASTPDRDNVWIVQTPQCFRYEVAFEAYSRLMRAEAAGELGNLHVTDDAMVVEHFTGSRVRLVMGSYDNIKITTPEDMIVAERILEAFRD